MAVPGDVVEASVDTRAVDIGLASPPSRVHVRPLRTASGWTLWVTAPADSREDVLEWLARLGADRVEAGPSPRQGSATGALRATFRSPPWGESGPPIGLVSVLILDPDGRARVRLVGERRDVRAFVDAAQARAEEVVVRRVTRSSEGVDRLLTLRQREVLEAASRAGYYEIPRRLNLIHLAKGIGASPAAVSEILRRAEARIVREHLRRTMLGVGDGERGPPDDDRESATAPRGASPPGAFGADRRASVEFSAA